MQEKKRQEQESYPGKAKKEVNFGKASENMKRPLVLIAATFVLGDALGNQINLDPRIAIITLASLLICAFLCNRRYWLGTGIVILALFLVTGFLWNGLARQKIEVEGRAWPSGPVVFTGTVVEDPTGYSDRTVYILGKLRLTGDTGSRSLKGRAQLVIYVPEPQTRYHYGDRLQVRGKMELPSFHRNPGEFDYREYLARHGVYGRVSAFRPADVTLIGQETGNPLIGISLAAKGRVVSLVDSVLPPRQAGVMLAMLFGDRERLDGQQVDLYRTLGVMHIFSVSGLHVGFVLFFLLVLGRLMRWSPLVETLAAVIVLIFYSAMVGFPSSVVRAMVMAIMVLGARLVMREPDFYTSLAAAALVILLWNPLQLNEPGFQLSFMATWGLVYLEPVIEGWLSFLPGWRRVLIAPITAQLGVLPLTALYFNSISLLAIPANIIVVGLAGVITVLGLVMFVLALTFAPVGEMIALAVGGLVFMMEKMLNVIGKIPWAAFTVSSPAWFTIGTYYLIVIAFREYWLHRSQPRWAVTINRWRKEVVLGLLAVFLLMFMLSGNGKSDRLQVIFLDVGQGDAIFIQTPGNYTALVDGGGTAGANGDQGGRVILPYLHRKGIRKLDLVVSSHPDSDHLLGLFSVAKEIPVARVILPPVPEPPGDYADFINILENRKINYTTAVKGAVAHLGPDVRLEVLHPMEATVRGGSGDNNNSMVLKLVYGSTSVLLTGDIEREAMDELLASSGNLRSTVIKMPHHGSKSGLNREFLRRVAPEAVVISVGRNSFGHPSVEILEFWSAEGIPVFRTDLLGAVSFYSDGSQWSIEGLHREEQQEKNPGVSGRGLSYVW